MENSIEELNQILDELYRTLQARLDVGADDLDIREEIAEVEEEIKKLQDETMEENSIKNERSSIKEDIERLKLCSTNQCHICGRYEKEECMLERNRCEQHILSDYKRVLKENECLKNHVHYKNCIACGKEFKSKRNDAKYCIKCSKQIANKNYIANLTEEQKLKRREQAKLAMRKLRANRK